LVSSSLLHIGTWHIVSNITAMLIVGYAVESQLGLIKTAICFIGSVLISGLFMAFVYKLQEGEGASTGIYGLIAVFLMIAIKNGTLMFSDLPILALIILGIYTVGGMFVGKATAFEHISGFTGGLLFGLILI
jgi:rhomboid protease GluP